MAWIFEPDVEGKYIILHRRTYIRQGAGKEGIVDTRQNGHAGLDPVCIEVGYRALQTEAI